MNNYFMYLIASYLFIFASCEINERPIVNTDKGKVAGKKFKSLIHKIEYSGFLGIPYAVPPTGKLRFLPPQPHNGWENTLVTEKEKEPCVQANYNVRRGPLLRQYGKEDCLYLNIFTPNLEESTNKKTVVVFIYNEHFRNACNSSDYGPDFFIEEGVILVTINHRLSMFGFISTGDDILPGNAGLKDIVLGLQWIYKNIIQFGGDPYKITLMGVQGGAVAVDLLLHSKKAEGLFRSVILQSGSSFSSKYLQSNFKERAFKLGEKLDTVASTSKLLLKDLNDAAVDELLKKEWNSLPEDYFKEEQKGLVAFSPTIENNTDGLLTHYPENNDNRIDVPVLIGFNSREGIDSAIQYLIEPRYLYSVEKYFPLYLPIRTDFRFDPDNDAYLEAIEDIKKFYFTKGHIQINRIDEYTTYIGDAVSMYPMDYAVRKYAKDSLSSIFYYHFDYSGELNENKNDLLRLSTISDEKWGAATGDELCYLFVCSNLKRQYIKLNKTTSDELLVQRNLIRLWTNFAKHGNPTPDGMDTQLKWIPYSEQRKSYLHIGSSLELKENLYIARFSFWDEFINKWRRNAVNGVVKTFIREDL